MADVFASRLTAAKIALGMGYLAHYGRTGNDEDAGSMERALRRALGPVSSC